MKYSSIILLMGLILVGCRPSATPISIANKPIDSSRMKRTNLPMPPTKPVEELSWTLIDGAETQKISDYRGKVLILDFWATYCPPCIEEIPHLNGLKEKYGAEGLEIIGLNVGGDEDKPNIPAFRNRLNIDYPLAYPEDALTATLLNGDDRIPQTLIFNREGKMVAKFVSFDEKVGTEITKTITGLFNE